MQSSSVIFGVIAGPDKLGILLQFLAFHVKVYPNNVLQERIRRLIVKFIANR